MSDEETDSEEANSFVKRSPPWRSHKLDRLFKALDERYDLKNQTSLKRNRKTGMPSERPIPNGLPGWAKNTPLDELLTVTFFISFQFTSTTNPYWSSIVPPYIPL